MIPLRDGTGAIYLNMAGDPDDEAKSPLRLQSQ